MVDKIALLGKKNDACKYYSFILCTKFELCYYLRLFTIYVFFLFFYFDIIIFSVYINI